MPPNKLRNINGNVYVYFSRETLNNDLTKDVDKTHAMIYIYKTMDENKKVFPI